MEKELLEKIAALAGFINNQKRLVARTLPSNVKQNHWENRNNYYQKPLVPNSGEYIKKGNKLIRKKPTDYVKTSSNKLVRKEIIKNNNFPPKSNIRKISAQKFALLKSRKNLHLPNRLIVNGLAFEKSSNGQSLIRSKTDRVKQFTSQKVKDSIRNLQGNKKKQLRPQKQVCIFYTKFGKCNNIETCKYTHDPNKKAICRKFLKGECHDGYCLLLHKIDSERMPVCSYFLRGICTSENCPYSHVNVNPKAAICLDFSKGYCPLGEKCKLKHVEKRNLITTEVTPNVSQSVVDSGTSLLPIRPIFSSSVNKA